MTRPKRCSGLVELGSRTVSPAPASGWDSRIKECLAEETGAAVEAVKLKGATPAVEAVKLKGATPMDLSAAIGAGRGFTMVWKVMRWHTLWPLYQTISYGSLIEA